MRWRLWHDIQVKSLLTANQHPRFYGTLLLLANATPANFASAKGRTVFVDEARSDAVWVYKRGTLPLTSPCEGKDCKHSGDKLQSSIGMKSSTLPLTSPCSGTKRKTTVPLFFASTGGLRLLSFIPILLLSLKIIDFYSPSLRWLSANISELRLPLLQTYTASVA